MKKRLLAVLLTAAMVLGMTACGSKSNSGSSDKKEEAQSTDDIKECTIKFQYWADNTDYSSLMQDIIKKFNEENKYGITVEGEEVPWDGGGYSNTLFNAAMGGGAPDVATFKLSATPMFTNNNLLADLTPYVDAWDKKDDISDNIYDVMKKAGTYSIMFSGAITVCGFIYAKICDAESLNALSTALDISSLLNPDQLS
nr:extracellular solute-binding protein [Faecalicatena contorta]